MTREERVIRKEYFKEWSRLEDLVRRNSIEWRKVKREVGGKMEGKRRHERERLDKKRDYLVRNIKDRETESQVERERETEKTRGCWKE